MLLRQYAVARILETGRQIFQWPVAYIEPGFIRYDVVFRVIAFQPAETELVYHERSVQMQVFYVARRQIYEYLGILILCSETFRG